MSFVTLKVKIQGLKEEARRVSVPSNTTLEELRVKLVALFQREDLFAAFAIQYQDADGDFITITSNEEFEEAVRLSVASVADSAADQRPVLHVYLVPSVAQPSADNAAAPCCACPVSRFLNAHRGGPNGRRCCPGKVIKCAVIGIIGFRLLSFIAHHFLFLALLALPFIAFGAIRRRCARQRACFFARGCQAAEACVRPPVNSAVESQHSQPAVQPVGEGRRDGNVSGAVRFQELLEQLRNMGFHDKTKNIDVLIRTNLELPRAVELLLSQ